MNDDDYAYQAPDLEEFLSLDNAADVTLREVFAAGERYGADLQRGAIFGALEDWVSEAKDDGADVVTYIRQHLIRQAEDDDFHEDERLRRRLSSVTLEDLRRDSVPVTSIEDLIR